MNGRSKIIPTAFLLIISFKIFAQKNKPAQIDSTSNSYKAVTINGKKYIGFLNSNGFQLLNSKRETFVKQPGDYFTWEFKDFNKDGHNDIFLDKGGNTPDVFDLLLYIPSLHSFKFIQDFENFPAPEQIPGTKYFYSYHKSGCADLNWDSDLFYIRNFKAIRIGNISGRQCENSGENDGLYINKLHGEKKVLLETFSIETIYKYKDNKWGFIREYWTKNYKLFL